MRNKSDFWVIDVVRFVCFIAAVFVTLGFGAAAAADSEGSGEAIARFLVAGGFGLVISVASMGGLYVAMGCARVYLQSQFSTSRPTQVPAAARQAQPMPDTARKSLGDPELDAIDQAELERFRGRA